MRTEPSFVPAASKVLPAAGDHASVVNVVLLSGTIGDVMVDPCFQFQISMTGGDRLLFAAARNVSSGDHVSISAPRPSLFVCSECVPAFHVVLFPAMAACPITISLGKAMASCAVTGEKARAEITSENETGVGVGCAGLQSATRLLELLIDGLEAMARYLPGVHASAIRKAVTRWLLTVERRSAV